MRPLPVKVWHELQSAVVSLSDAVSFRDVLEVILFWISNNYRYLAGEPFSIYGFDGIAKMDKEVMPVEYSSFKASDLKKIKSVISRYQAREVEAIARFLRDTVEELVTIEVDEQCPRCESDGMRVFVGKYNGLLAYQCNVCGFSHYSDGTRVERDGLEFASTKNLHELGLI